MDVPGPFDAHEVDLHGHRAVYRVAGSGPAVVLVYGMINSSRHWEGVAMQFFYQFPQRTERLVLVSSGGLGPEVSPLLRGAAMPGSALLLRLATQPRLVDAIAGAGTRLRARGAANGVYLQAVARALRPLQDAGARRAFLETLRAVIDRQGQRVSARDRLYLLKGMPTMVVWGERDRTIPLEHGLAARDAIPGCRFELLPNAAHFPNLEDPAGLADVLADFVATTTPARIDDEDWGGLVGRRARATIRRVA